VSECGDVVSVS